MAPFAVALSACCFFLGSLAMSCVDDEVAMFQGMVQIRRDPILADVKLVQESMAVTTEMLADINTTLAKVKAGIEKLESSPARVKSATLKFMTQTLLPKMKTMDESIVALDHKLSNMSWDWFSETFDNATEGRDDGLHSVSKVTKTLASINDWMSTLNPNAVAKNKLGAMGAKALQTADTMVNGKTQVTSGVMWQVANATLSGLKKSLATLKDSKEAFDKSVNLWADAMTTLASSSAASDPTVADAIAEFAVVADTLYKDYLNKQSHYDNDFENAFNDLKTTKEMKALEEELKSKKALADVKSTISDVKKVSSTVGNIMKIFHRGHFR